MDIFSQNKLLIRTILFLVVLNLGSITFFTIREMRPNRERDFPPSDEKKKELSTILKKELNLSDEQVAQFDKIREQNASKKSELKQTINQDKDLLNQEMFNKNSSDDQLLALARKIGDNEYRIELSKINQSKQLKAVCNAQQLDKFQDLMIEMRDYLRPNNQPKPN
jgi:Spy/CpxP family protein refolding chaperone